MQHKRNPEALIRVRRWKRASEHLVGGHRRSISSKAWDVLKCGYRWRRVQRGEETLRRRRCWLNWVEKAEVRVLSVNMMERGSPGSCLWFTKAQWQDAFYREKQTKKMSDSSREGLPRVSEDRGMLAPHCTSFWSQSQELFPDPGC